ncbi:MAG: hypothetical protein QJR13_00210 [Bacillota bacterium]|nr:hypothetical protein [Bacillota bacterium]
MWLKVWGSLLVLAAGTAWGMAEARRLSARTRTWRLFASGLSMLETEISYALTSLPAAFQEVARRLPAGAVRSFFAECGALLERGEGTTAGECWRRAVESVLDPAASLKPEDREILLGIGGYLGLSDARDQVRQLRLARERAGERERACREEERQKGRLFCYVGFAFGALIVLVLI